MAEPLHLPYSVQGNGTVESVGNHFYRVCGPAGCTVVMGLSNEHEIFRRRRSRNVGLALVLIAFVALVFGLTVVKVQQGDMMEGFDHQPRVSVLPPEPAPSTEPAAEAPATHGRADAVDDHRHDQQ